MLFSGLSEYFVDAAVARERGLVFLLLDFIVRLVRLAGRSRWTWHGRRLRKGENVLEDDGGEDAYDGTSVPQKNIKYDIVVSFFSSFLFYVAQ
jgi:hypothetical protein